MYNGRTHFLSLYLLQQQQFSSQLPLLFSKISIHVVGFWGIAQSIINLYFIAFILIAIGLFKELSIISPENIACKLGVCICEKYYFDSGLLSIIRISRRCLRSFFSIFTSFHLYDMRINYYIDIHKQVPQDFKNQNMI